MHGIHHSKRFDEINSNWSSVLSWWDRLHGTLRLDVPQRALDIGVAGYLLPAGNTVRSVHHLGRPPPASPLTGTPPPGVAPTAGSRASR